jgi:hypothetical protein
MHYNPRTPVAGVHPLQLPCRHVLLQTTVALAARVLRAGTHVCVCQCVCVWGGAGVNMVICEVSVYAVFT